MKQVCSLIVAVLCLAGNALPQRFILSTRDQTLSDVQKAVKDERTFSLPGFRSTVVYAESIVSADSRLLRLSGVSLKTGDVYIEADGLEYGWDSHEAKLIGASKVLSASGPSAAH